jgi:ABC-2 type transport system ATP-binding protein
MIQVESLSKDYAGRQAIRDVTFNVAKGEILGFLGPNGAGKTTTMRILTGYLPPSGGRASIAGFDVTAESLEARRHIGYLPESTPLYRELTIRDYLDFTARLRGVPGARRKAKVDLAVEKLNLGAYVDRPISSLSKGYRQRVGIAQAVLHEPDVMILDEPTEGLDPRQRNETRQLIRDLGKEHTVVLSTHILPEVEATCDRVVIINAGTVVASDTVASLAQRSFQSQSLELLVGAEEAHVFLALKDVPDIVNLRAEPLPGHRCRVVIETAPNAEVRHLVARALIQAECDLFELKAGAHTLEDVFLQLTRDDGGAELAPEAAAPEPTPAPAASAPDNPEDRIR